MTDPALVDDWFPVARVDEVPLDTPRSARLLGLDLVLWRGRDGTLSALEDRCPHRAVQLSLGRIENERLVCPYHGWSFDRGGTCVSIPAHPARRAAANTAVRRFQSREHLGLWWVCIGQPRHVLPSFPEWDDERFTKASFGPYRFAASPFRVVENAFDVPHFAILHSTQLGDATRAEIPPFDATWGPEGLRMEDVRIWQPNIDGMGTRGEVRYDHYLTRPLTIYTVKTFEGGRQTALFTITPVDDELAVAWGWSAFAHGLVLDDARFRAYQDQLYEDDRRIVESQRPKRLPLLPFRPSPNAPRAEVHVESDRGAVAYRHWLSALGIEFGVC